MLAPIASSVAEGNRNPCTWSARRFRAAMSDALRHEIVALRSSGTVANVLTPTSLDIAAMGMNWMDPGRAGEVYETARQH